MSRCLTKIKIGLRKFGHWFCAHWKKILGVTFKLAIIAIGAFAVFVLVVLGQVEWDQHYVELGDRSINEQYGIDVRYFADGTDRLWNAKTKKYTTHKILWVGNQPPRDSISVYSERNKLRGFYNTHTGEITIPGRYKHAWYFSEGVAAVVGDDNRVRFIDYDGSEAVPGSFHYSEGYDYVFKDGLCEMYNDSTGKTGLLRRDGTWAFEQEYTYISDLYVDGYYITSRNNQFQLWKSDFTPAFEGTFDHLSIADDGKGVYALKDHVKQLLDYSGKVLEPFIIDGTYPLKYMVKYNSDEADEYEIIPEVVVYQVNCWEGLMDKRSGKILTPAVYHNFTLISPTLIRAQFEYYDNESVLMDLKGNILRNK